MGIISERRRKARVRRMRRRLMIAAGVMLLGALAMNGELRKQVRNVQQVFALPAQAEVTLPRREVYALQLGVFDSGERAAAEAQRLSHAGVRCVVWQREKMRIVSSAALGREKLDMASANGQEAYVIKEILPRVALRIEAGAGEIEAVRRLLETPDSAMMHLLTEEMELAAVVGNVQKEAETALNAHPEHALFTQLAQSLVNWCALMRSTMDNATPREAGTYAVLTMCTLCRELRTALANQTQSEASTASAQRTPSTAADVMPPA